MVKAKKFKCWKRIKNAPRESGVFYLNAKTKKNVLIDELGNVRLPGKNYRNLKTKGNAVKFAQKYMGEHDTC